MSNPEFGMGTSTDLVGTSADRSVCHRAVGRCRQKSGRHKITWATRYGGADTLPQSPTIGINPAVERKLRTIHHLPFRE